MSEKIPSFFGQFIHQTASDSEKNQIKATVRELRKKERESNPAKLEEKRSLELEIGKTEWKTQKLLLRLQDLVRKNREFQDMMDSYGELCLNDNEKSQGNTIQTRMKKTWNSYTQNIDRKQQLKQQYTTLDDVIGKEEVEEAVQAFLSHQKCKWREAGWEREDIEQYFTEEYLSSLTLEDYILLLQRFPGELVTHVTRQGIRDQSRMAEHTDGIGQYSNGFVDITAGDQRLHSVVGRLIVQQKMSDDFFMEFLRHPNSREEALRRIHVFTDSTHTDSFYQGTFGDKVAVHFAAEYVLGEYYGGETGNQIFVAFPSVFIANNCFFSNPHYMAGDFARKTIPPSESHIYNRYNDVYAVPRDRDGLHIDAGIVFLPKDASVHPNHGSQYELDEHMQATPTNEYSTIRSSWIVSETASAMFDNLCYMQEDRKTLTDMREYISQYIETHAREIAPHFRVALVQELLEEIEAIVEGRQKIDTGRIQNIKQRIQKPFNLSEPRDVYRLQTLGVYYQRGGTVIPSERFWETYFSKYPDRRPRHVVYYSGDPSIALEQWRQKYGIKLGLSDEDGSTTHAKFPQHKVIDGATNFSIRQQKNISKEFIKVKYYPGIFDSPGTLDLQDMRQRLGSLLIQTADRVFSV
ncbi:MAG: hypothetical protein HYV41_04285 [Candidatus Magasanikbacteria bacterium]|nr:hypothetical protein [Candidatus Magasanikbacteria bacterium]